MTAKLSIIFWSDDETELLEDVKIDKEKELEKGKEYMNEIKTINVDININIEDFESFKSLMTQLDHLIWIK